MWIFLAILFVYLLDQSFIYVLARAWMEEDLVVVGLAKVVELEVELASVAESNGGLVWARNSFYYVTVNNNVTIKPKS